jgi:hypothetical protein
MIEPGKLNGYLVAIKKELRKAEKKHPKFCDEMKNENCDYRFFEARYKEFNSKGPYYALDLLQEEIFEAMVAHQYKEKEYSGLTTTINIFFTRTRLGRSRKNTVDHLPSGASSNWRPCPTMNLRKFPTFTEEN